MVTCQIYRFIPFTIGITEDRTTIHLFVFVFSLLSSCINISAVHLFVSEFILLLSSIIISKNPFKLFLLASFYRFMNQENIVHYIKTVLSETMYIFVKSLPQIYISRAFRFLSVIIVLTRVELTLMLFGFYLYCLAEKEAESMFFHTHPQGFGLNTSYPCIYKKLN